jgi:DNA polymerase I
VTAEVVALQPYRDLLAIKAVLREAGLLGARFRLSGYGVEIETFADLPAQLQQSLRHHVESGLLYAYLGGEELELPALDLADRLGVAAVLVETRAQVKEAIRCLIGDLKEHGPPLGLDIETSPRPEFLKRHWARLNDDGTLAAIQPSPLHDVDKPGIDPHRSDIATLQLYAGGRRCFIFCAAALQQVIDSHWLRRQHLVIHGATFEWKFLLHHCRNYRPPLHRRARFRCECSLQATGLLTGVGFGGETRRLDRAAKHFLNIDVPKELQTSDWGAVQLAPGQIAYAASDAILARRLWPLLKDGLHQKKRRDAYELQRRAVPAVADMELRGIAFDRDEHRRQTELWAHQLAEAREQYVAATGKPPPGKPAEIRAWLGEVLTADELARWPRTKTDGLLSISNDALKQIGHVAGAQPVLAILAREKLLSTFGANLVARLNPVTGRLHPSFNLAATKAGRFSASEPNFQQFPTDKRAEGFRRCVVAEAGNVIIGCDFNQVELRALAWLAKNSALTKVYADGKDLHRETAAKIARVPIDAVTDAQRSAAKAVNFGCIFGLGSRGLAAYAFNTYGVVMSERDAGKYLDQFFAGYPGLKEHLRRHADLCQGRKYVVIGAGRVVEARWERFGISYQQCCNLPVQGIAADCMLRAIILTYIRLRAAGIRGGLIASIHDELLLEVPEPDAEAARVLLETAMIEAFTQTFPGAPANGVAAAKIGRSWADVK